MYQRRRRGFYPVARVGTSEERAMKMVAGALCVLLFALTTHGHAFTSASSCESLSSLALPNTSIALAQIVPAGKFALPGTGPATPQFSELRAFCRVVATLTPSSDSHIKIEVWLPIADWNGKFEAVGNGGWAEPSATAGWPRRCGRVTQRHRRTLDTQTPMRHSR